MTDQHPAVAHLLAAHERAVEVAQATTPVPMAGQWTVVRDKHADRDAPLSLIQGEDHDVPEYEGQSSEDYSYGLPVIVLAADWQDEAEANLRHIALHDPRSVLLRVAEERNILTEHAPTPREASGEYCSVCSQAEEQPQPVGWWVPYPCRTVVGLAKAWGWKENGDG